MLRQMLMQWVLMAEAESETGSGGSSSTTAAIPSTTAEQTAEEDTSSVQGGDDWDALATGSDEDDGGAGDETPPADTPPTEDETPPVTQAPPQGATETPPKQDDQTPPAGTETPPATTPPAQTPATETPAPQPTAEEARAQAEAAAAREFQQLEQWYQLPQEVVAQLEGDGLEAVLPKLLPNLAARVHQAVLASALQQVQAVLPSAFHHFSTMNEVQTQARNEFFTRWPGLKDYSQQVLDVGTWFRQKNPSATKEEALERVGALVYASLGMAAPGASASGTPPVTSAGPAPTVTSRSTFRPATPGAGAPPAAPPRKGNEFENLAQEFLDEDMG